MYSHAIDKLRTVTDRVDLSGLGYNVWAWCAGGAADTALEQRVDHGALTQSTLTYRGRAHRVCVCNKCGTSTCKCNKCGGTDIG